MPTEPITYGTTYGTTYAATYAGYSISVQDGRPLCRQCNRPLHMYDPDIGIFVCNNPNCPEIRMFNADGSRYIRTMMGKKEIRSIMNIENELKGE